MKLRFPLVLATAWILGPAAAWGGGYDTPMLYSARHMGMGGTAIAFVDDPSALFHNPAGLAHVERANVLGDFSLLLARTHASPSFGVPDVDSQLTVAPGFLVGGGYRVARRVVIGLGAYPVASAGATYKYPFGESNVENRTRLVFLEVSPAVAINLPGRVRLGAGYRITYVSLERYLGDPSQGSPGLDFAMKGLNFLGLRVGAQWSATDWLEIGASYRHKTSTKVTNTEGVALNQRFTDIETTFVLPSRFGFGARADVGPVGIAADAEYTLQSQNDAYPLIGTPPVTDTMPAPEPTAVPNVFDWQDAVTLRAGVEYRLLPLDGGHPLLAGRAADRRRLALRLGYIFDGTVTNRHYPTPFGTPPGPSHIFTVGAGWMARRWQVNVAYGYRFGEGAVTLEDINDPSNRVCRFCGYAGNDPYKIKINALYVDFSFAFD